MHDLAFDIAHLLAGGMVVVSLALLYQDRLYALINGFATILLFAFIDPRLSVMTDDAVEGKVDEADFRRAITFISLSRLAGTILAQALLLPAATLIAYVSVHV